MELSTFDARFSPITFSALKCYPVSPILSKMVWLLGKCLAGMGDIDIELFSLRWYLHLPYLISSLDPSYILGICQLISQSFAIYLLAFTLHPRQLSSAPTPLVARQHVVLCFLRFCWSGFLDCS